MDLMDENRLNLDDDMVKELSLHSAGWDEPPLNNWLSMLGRAGNRSACTL